jgi:hypothetical protein
MGSPFLNRWLIPSLISLWYVKKLLESDYPGPEAPALRPIHGFATAISKAFFRQSLVTLTWPRGPGFSGRTKVNAAFKTNLSIRPAVIPTTFFQACFAFLSYILFLL